MSNQIRLKRGSGSAPSASDLVVGEVALRTDTGQLFTKKDDGNVEEIGAQGGVSDGDRGDITVSNSGATFTIDSGVITSDKILDGTITGSDLATNVDLVDNQKIRLGTGNDLELFHTGSHSIFRDSGTGALLIQGSQVNIQNAIGSENYAAFKDNGAVELYYDNSKKFETTSTGALLGDHTIAAVNTLSKGVLDLGAQYSNTDGTPKLFLYNDTNAHLGFGISSNQLDVCLSSSNFDFVTYQGTTELFRVEGTGNVQIPADDKKLQIGASQDLEIFKDGNHCRIKDNQSANGFATVINTDHLRINNLANTENIARFVKDGAVELYYDNSKKFETFSSGISVTNQVKIPDGGKYFLGSDDDMYLNHSGSHGAIHNATGNMYFSTAGSIFFSTQLNESAITANANGAVELYHNNSKKFETTSSGVSVTGAITSTGTFTINSTSPAINLTESDADPDFQIKVSGGDFKIKAAGVGKIIINDDGHIDLIDHVDISSGLDVTGNITVTGTVDGVDIAARDTLFGSLISSNATLTNGVIATTQSAGDSSTKVATTAFVSTAVSNLVDSAPGTLNTLNELAAALGDDANFSTTVTNSIATKLALSWRYFNWKL